MNMALHPGYITSKNDGQKHYIDAIKLAKLHGLDIKDCILWDDNKPETSIGRQYDDYTHIYPDFNGDYFDAETIFVKGTGKLRWF